MYGTEKTHITRNSESSAIRITRQKIGKTRKCEWIFEKADDKKTYTQKKRKNAEQPAHKFQRWNEIFFFCLNLLFILWMDPDFKCKLRLWYNAVIFSYTHSLDAFDTFKSPRRMKMRIVCFLFFFFFFFFVFSS